MVVAVAATIAVAWTRIEARPVGDPTTEPTTTTTTTTTTVVTTTTLSRDDANQLICDLAGGFADKAALVPADAGPGPVARLALDFWRKVETLTAGGARAEVTAVVNYYEDYLETAAPFDFNTARIIVGGDKEKLQQLITRPAAGLEASRSLIGWGCRVVVPDQPTMRATAFEELEDRLLDPEDKS